MPGCRQLVVRPALWAFRELRSCSWQWGLANPQDVRKVSTAEDKRKHGSGPGLSQPFTRRNCTGLASTCLVTWRRCECRVTVKTLRSRCGSWQRLVALQQATWGSTSSRLLIAFTWAQPHVSDHVCRRTSASLGLSRWKRQRCATDSSLPRSRLMPSHVVSLRASGCVLFRAAAPLRRSGSCIGPLSSILRTHRPRKEEAKTRRAFAVMRRFAGRADQVAVQAPHELPSRTARRCVFI